MQTAQQTERQQAERQQATDWRPAVRVVRGADLDAGMTGPGGSGRATIFDFSGEGDEGTWIGSVVIPAGLATGMHRHGHHEVSLSVITGRVEIRWGERLEFLAEAGPGDHVYFAPFVPHQERNLSETETARFLVVRTGGERIAEPLPGETAARADAVY
jgi:uncharacterized RmlC-like cupin family protein